MEMAGREEGIEKAPGLTPEEQRELDALRNNKVLMNYVSSTSPPREAFISQRDVDGSAQKAAEIEKQYPDIKEKAARFRKLVEKERGGSTHSA